MSFFFLRLYQYFQERKALFIGIWVTLLLLGGYAAWNLPLEEDISQMMPADDNVDMVGQIFSESRFAEKIVVHVYLKDSATPDPALLKKFTQTLTQKMDSTLVPKHLEEVRDKVSQAGIFEMYEVFYQNLPLLLEPKDYKELEKTTQPAEVENRLASTYKTLLSPASYALKKFLIKDPLGMASLATGKLQSLRLNENLELDEGYIMSRDRRSLLFFMIPKASSGEARSNEAFLADVDNVFEQVGKDFPLAKAEYFGAAAIAVGNARQIRRDVAMTVGIALTLLMIFITWYFRQPTVIFVIFLPVLFGAIMSVITVFLVKGSVSLIALGIGAILLGISVDFSLHIFTHHRATGSVAKTLRDLSTPILISGLTTASAFMCLFLVRAPALHDLGLFAAVSVIFAAILALVLLPHFLKKRNPEDNNLPKDTGLDKLARFPLHRKKWLVGAVILISLGVSFFAGKVTFESDLTSLNYMSDDLKAVEDRLDAVNEFKLRSVFLVSNGKTLGEALRKQEDLLPKLEELKAEGKIDDYVSASTFLMTDSLQQERINRWNAFWTTERKARVLSTLKEKGKAFKFKENAFQEFGGLLEKSFSPVPHENFKPVTEVFLRDFIAEEKGQTTVTTLLNVPQENKPVVYNAFEENSEVSILDKQYITSRFVEILKEDFDLLVMVSLLLVLIILVHTFGRIELGLIAFLPMLLSWMWTLGIMGLFGLEFNIFNIIISTFIFGLGIDYSIFIMRGLMDDYKYGRKHLPSYKTSILLSAITTLAGIGVMVFAQHPALRSIASLSMIGISSVVLISFTIEPLMFGLLVRANGKKRMLPVTLKNFVFSIFEFLFFLTGALLYTLFGFILKLLPFPKKKKQYVFHAGLRMLCTAILYVYPDTKVRYINDIEEDFSKPAVIIANHQAHIDIPLILMLHPKIIILTNDWVYNNPFYGAIVRMADFFPVSKGLDAISKKLEEKVADGYSVMVFPEGSRSPDWKIKRFHKGAFVLAEQLGLDILPVLIHGAGEIINKGEPILRSGIGTLKILPRITPDNPRFASPVRKRTKAILAYMREEFASLRQELETPRYFRNRLIKNYIYKGPVLEWYLKVKIRLENDYEPFHKLMPRKGTLTDLGCGYGFMSYMLSFLSEERQIFGVDYDEEKIIVANHCISKNERLEFRNEDVSTCEIPESDGIIISDVLHYLPEEKQEKVIANCIQKLKPEGVLVIRDGDASLQNRHKGTKLTEFFSTKFGFNKTRIDQLCYIPKERMVAMVAAQGLETEVIDDTQFTSNLIYVIRKKGNG